MTTTGGTDDAGMKSPEKITMIASRLRAAKNSNPEVIEALLKSGANAKDKEGKTAADHAKDNEKIYKTKLYWKLNELQHE